MLCKGVCLIWFLDLGRFIARWFMLCQHFWVYSIDNSVCCMMICCSVVFSYVLDFSSRIVFGRKLPWYVDDLAYIVAGCCLLAVRVMAMSSGLSFISLSYELARAWWLCSLDRIRNFVVPLKPEKIENFLYKPDRVHFIDLLLNQNSTSTPFDHVPLVILEMVFSILSFCTLKPHHGGFCWETDTIECLICPVVYKIKKCHREVHIIHC